MAKHMEVEMQDCQTHGRITGTGTGRQLLRLIEQLKERQRKVENCRKHRQTRGLQRWQKPGISEHSQNTIRHAPDVMIRHARDCNLQLRLQESSVKPFSTESLQEFATETLQASMIR